MSGYVAGRKNGDLVFLERDERFLERRTPGQDVAQPGPSGSEQPVHLRVAEVSIQMQIGIAIPGPSPGQGCRLSEFFLRRARDS